MHECVGDVKLPDGPPPLTVMKISNAPQDRVTSKGSLAHDKSM